MSMFAAGLIHLITSDGVERPEESMSLSRYVKRFVTSTVRRWIHKDVLQFLLYGRGV